MCRNVVNLELSIKMKEGIRSPWIEKQGLVLVFYTPSFLLSYSFDLLILISVISEMVFLTVYIHLYTSLPNVRYVCNYHNYMPLFFLCYDKNSYRQTF